MFGRDARRAPIPSTRKSFPKIPALGERTYPTYIGSGFCLILNRGTGLHNLTPYNREELLRRAFSAAPFPLLPFPQEHTKWGRRRHAKLVRHRPRMHNDASSIQVRPMRIRIET
jgi:hypothetical protein